MARTLIGFSLVLAIFAGLGALGWYLVKEQIRNMPEYRLSAENITISPPPDWISDRFVVEVLQSSGLNRTGSLLDKKLPHKLTEAFTAHPWVEKVEHIVSRYPSGAEVKLSYRVPIALVEIPQRGVVPVDRNGVLLPQTYLTDSSSEQWSKHLVIQGIQSMPLGSAGTPWGDPMVLTAAQLAEELSDIAEPLNLAHIIPEKETVPSGTRIVCRLKTAGGMEFHWGAFVPNDPKNKTKQKKLLDLHDQFRSLDNIPANFRPYGRYDLSRE
jgi:hypothetical protein